MNLDIPQAWMVEAVKSPYDLDNIYLKEVRMVYGLVCPGFEISACLAVDSRCSLQTKGVNIVYLVPVTC